MRLKNDGQAYSARLFFTVFFICYSRSICIRHMAKTLGLEAEVQIGPTTQGTRLAFSRRQTTRKQDA